MARGRRDDQTGPPPAGEPLDATEEDDNRFGKYAASNFLGGLLGTFDFGRGNQARQIISNKIKGFLPSVGSTALFSPLHRQLVIEVGLDFRKHALESRGCKVCIHVFQQLASVEDPIQSLDSATVMFLVCSIDASHGSGKGLGFVYQVVKAGHGPLQCWCHIRVSLHLSRLRHYT